ncbi:hypothetical protein ACAN107058_17465 [Paracidovorax anthurii]
MCTPMNTTWKPHTKYPAVSSRKLGVRSASESASPTVCWRGALAALAVRPKPGSRSPKASGTMSSTMAERASSDSCQPRRAMSWPSTGTIRNCPNEPAAAATPMAQERRSGAICRPSTP